MMSVLEYQSCCLLLIKGVGIAYSRSLIQYLGTSFKKSSTTEYSSCKISLWLALEIGIFVTVSDGGANQIYVTQIAPSCLLNVYILNFNLI